MAVIPVSPQPGSAGHKKSGRFRVRLAEREGIEGNIRFRGVHETIIEPGILDELNACKKENVELREINAALIRRDVKFEEMQAEIDALRNELKLARDSREATAVVETKQQPSQTKVIPPSLRGPKS